MSSYNKQDFSNHNNDLNTTSLDFKDHKLFFEKFYMLRALYIDKSYSFISDKKKDTLGELVGVLISLIDWTNSHLSYKCNIEELKNEIFEASQLKDSVKIYTALDNIYIKISKLHEEAEILPKTKISEDEKSLFWREEGDKSIKEMKKAFFDLFILNN